MNANGKSSLEELLLASDGEIISTPSKFANVIFKFESITWNEAQRKAAYLIKASEANNYLRKVRMAVDRDTNVSIQNAQTFVQSEIPANLLMIVPPAESLESSAEIFAQNYRLLTALVPELEQELPAVEEDVIVSGKSATNIHGSVSLRSIEKDKYGYYLQLEVIETAKSKQLIELYLSINEKSVKVLSCEGANGKFEVYDDIYTRAMVNPEQSETQNKYLNTLLKQLREFKLSIPTLSSVAIEQVTAPDLETEKTLIDWEKVLLKRERIEEQKLKQYWRSKSQQVQKENNELTELNGHLIKQSEILKLAGLASQVKNFNSLCTVIPNLPELTKYASCIVTLKSPHSDLPDYAIQCYNFDGEIHDLVCTLYEKNLETGENIDRCNFALYKENRIVFHWNEEGFFEVKDELIVVEPDEVSEESIIGGDLLFRLFTFMARNQYTATVSDCVYKRGQEPEVEEVDDDIVSEVVSDVVVGVGLVGILAAVFFGVKALR